ncbi:MAG: flagellar biosynthesis anti-sigma factor FlgM [Bryobacteraceae bacterium]
MKVNDPNLASLISPLSTSRTQEPERSTQSARTAGVGASGSGDDVHLSELVRSLRSLAAESPDRQARLEQIARSYANGTYKVDAEATASKMIDDAIEP